MEAFRFFIFQMPPIAVYEIFSSQFMHRKNIIKIKNSKPVPLFQ